MTIAMLMRPWALVMAVVAGVFASAAGVMAQPPSGSERVRPQVEVSGPVVRPGGRLVVRVTLDMDPGWHTYLHDAVEDPKLGIVPIPTRVALKDHPSVRAGTTRWPAPKSVTAAPMGTPIQLEVYGPGALVYVPITVSKDAAAGDLTLEMDLGWQACNDRICEFPEDRIVPVKVKVDPSGPEDTSSAFGTFGEADFAGGSGGSPNATGTNAGVSTGNAVGGASDGTSGGAEAARPSGPVEFNLFGLKFAVDPRGATGLALIMLVAMAGGFILNLTPCVLPVIPLKIIGLQQSAKHAGDGKSRMVALGLMLCAGIIAFWLVIGLLIVSLKAISSVNQAFGSPIFLLAVALFIGVMGLGIMGAFTINLPQAVYAVNPSHETLHGSFLFGIMTAVLGTPCFGPFAGAAAAWATQQPVLVAVSAFVAIGVGMAIPYLVLAFKPEWVSFIPSAGPASELVKQVMGLLLLATAAFFLGSGILSLVAEMPYLKETVHWWAVATFCVVAGVWLAYRTFQITPKPGRRVLFTVVALLLAGVPVAAASWFTNVQKLIAAHKWVVYTPEAEKQALGEGKVVLIDFTAVWCINCKAMEAQLLSQTNVLRAMTATDVVTFKADITSSTAPGKAKLASLNEVSIPVWAIEGPGVTQPIKLYFGTTASEVIGAIERARGVKSAGAQVVR